MRAAHLRGPTRTRAGAGGAQREKHPRVEDYVALGRAVEEREAAIIRRALTVLRAFYAVTAAVMAKNVVKLERAVQGAAPHSSM